MEVTLTPQHVTEALALARKRQGGAEANSRPGKNGAPSVGAKALALNVRGALAEKAVRVAWPEREIKWYAFLKQLRGEPDFEIGSLKIDVKGIDRVGLSFRLDLFARFN